MLPRLRRDTLRAMSESLVNSQSAVLAAADSCVKCGLCLPHCPTYGLAQHEAEGPRGRITLAQMLASGSVSATPGMQQHLDSCLACRNCERVCPAQVPFAKVLDGARQLLATPARTRSTRLMGLVLRHAPLRALARWLLWLLRPLPARWGRLWAARPLPQRLTTITSDTAADVALFAGCMGDIAERQVLHDAALLLRATGLRVALPSGQTCCGALYQHAGLPSDGLASRNQQAFAAYPVVLALTPGCGAGLKDAGGTLAAKVQDLSAFIAQRLAAHPLPLAATVSRVAVHVACTQANVMKAANAPQALLALLGVQQISLASHGCCGAAGTHFISHPAAADALLAPRLDALQRAAPQLLVSANIGCSLHFQQGLAARGLNLTVMHPISVVANAYRATCNAA